ncbi:MAG: hypothetical protein RLZZ387_2527, partial [Chloroflexota bacterium]
MINSTVSGVSASRIAHAANEEQYIAQWRTWRTFLMARRVLLDAADTIGAIRDAFEQTPDMATPASRAEAELARLTPDQREVFTRTLEDRVQRLQHLADAPSGGTGGVWLRDPDDVEREALRQLLDEASGESDQLPQGWGVVPMTDQLYQLDLRALLIAPDAATYAVRRGLPQDEVKRRLLMAGCVAILGIVGFILSLTMGGESSTSARAIQPATVNSAPAVLWTPLQLTLTGAANTDLPVSPVSGAWPAEAAGAAWRSTNALPLQLCAPGDLLAGVTQATVLSGGDHATRAYTLSATAPARPDLIIVACGGEATTRYGTLTGTEPPTVSNVGDQVMLPGDLALTLASLTIIGPGADPTLPPDQARVTALVRITGPQTVTQALTWPDYAPTLITITGARVSPAETRSTEDGAALTFLVALPSAPIEAALSITPPGAPQASRWLTRLDVPPARDAVLRAALRAEVEGAGADTLQVTLSNMSGEPLAVTPSDIALTSEGLVQPLPAIPELAEPLAPDERRA